MSNINNLVNSNLIYESSISNLNTMKANPKVKEFLDLSQKFVKEGKLSPEELKTAKNLFEDPVVKEYLHAAEQVGVRNGWISGSIIGGLTGTIVGGGIAAATLTSFAPIFALALLGGIATGLVTGKLFAVVNKILSRWKAEDSLVSKTPGNLNTHRIALGR